MKRPSSLPTMVVLAWLAQVALAVGLGRSRWAYGPDTVGPARMYDDVDLYDKYATKVFEGSVPYRDFEVEYPILALPLFLLPRAFAWDLSAYRAAFGVEMLLIDLAAVALLARRVAQAEGPGAAPARLAWYSVAVVVLCPMLMTRFDLAPMALALAAAIEWGGRRRLLGGALAAVGTLVKISPAALAAPALGWERGRRGSAKGLGFVGFAAVLAAGGAAWYGLGGEKVRATFAFHANRPPELGSFVSGLLIPAARLAKVPLALEYVHKSPNVACRWSATAARLAFPIQGLALLAVAWRSWRGRGREPLRHAAAALLAFVAFGKVLSPQYVVWPLALIGAVEGRAGARARPLYLLACLLTTAIYPWHIEALGHFEAGPVVLLNLRNGLLVAVWLVLMLAPTAAVPAHTEE
ncbi:MAG TPA: glycosyltransferase 87 family protein [Isosphaeraceae bacterium]|jgi:hypothetical protein|nr:glycosyltransferase 87 family protein [Isosphaeraceae bacterium]